MTAGPIFARSLLGSSGDYQVGGRRREWLDIVTRSLQDRGAIVAAALSVLLALALIELPYGYYRFLRIAIPLGGIFLAFRLHRDNQILWLLVAVAAVILFNPIYDMEFEEEEWKIVDGLFAFAFGALALWRIVPPAQKVKAIVGIGAAAAVAAAIAGDVVPSVPEDDSANNTATNYVEDPLMGYPADVYPVDAMNTTLPQSSYDSAEVSSSTNDSAANRASTDASTNFLDSLLAKPRPPSSGEPGPTLDDVADATNAAASAVAKAAEVEPN